MLDVQLADVVDARDLFDRKAFLVGQSVAYICKGLGCASEAHLIPFPVSEFHLEGGNKMARFKCGIAE